MADQQKLYLEQMGRAALERQTAHLSQSKKERLSPCCYCSSYGHTGRHCRQRPK